eukprot:5248403-Alexandrium_andersonii.AAC.1
MRRDPGASSSRGAARLGPDRRRRIREPPAVLGVPGGLESNWGVRRAATGVAEFRAPQDSGVGLRGITNFPEGLR